MATGIYVGVGGKARKVKSLYVGVDGKARKVTKGYIGVDGKARLFYAAEEIGKQWIFTSNGTFTVPVTGKYTIELHGAGGNSGATWHGLTGGRTRLRTGGGGGGSGEKYENVALSSGTSYDIVIGVRGSGSERSGGTTKFGELYSCAGGSGGSDATESSAGTGGHGSGSLAGDGENGGSNNDNDLIPASGGTGGSSVGSYGNGGDCDSMSDGSYGRGTNGAVIITLTSY